MPTLLEELGFHQLLADMNRETEDPSLDHYPKDGDFYCRGCSRPTSHFFVGMEAIIRRRPPRVEKPREIAYMCRLCKSFTEFGYCSPDEKLEFREIRK